MCGMARGRCQTHSRLANCTLVDCFHLLYVYLTSSVRVSFYQMVSFTQLKWISGRWVACTDKLLVSLPKQFPAISWSTSFSLKEARLVPSLPTPLYLMYVFRVVTSSIWLRKKKIVVPNIFFCKLFIRIVHFSYFLALQRSLVATILQIWLSFPPCQFTSPQEWLTAGGQTSCLSTWHKLTCAFDEREILLSEVWLLILLLGSPMSFGRNFLVLHIVPQASIPFLSNSLKSGTLVYQLSTNNLSLLWKWQKRFQRQKLPKL